MANESHDSVHKQRLSQLIAEVDGPPKSTMKTENAEREATRLLAGFLRWSAFGLVCLAAGFWTGSYNASLRFSLEKPSEIQDLNSQGWKSEGTGVFYRWCQHHCQSPTLYGGGVI